jgi:hypothetical protein
MVPDTTKLAVAVMTTVPCPLNTFSTAPGITVMLVQLVLSLRGYVPVTIQYPLPSGHGTDCASISGLSAGNDEGRSS